MESMGMFSMMLGISMIILGNNKDIMKMVLGLEILIIGISLLFMDLGLQYDEMEYLIMGIFLIMMGAIETGMGLTLMIAKITPSPPSST